MRGEIYKLLLKKIVIRDRHESSEGKRKELYESATPDFKPVLKWY